MEDETITTSTNESSQPLYHGTKADLKEGDLIQPGYNSNYGTRKKAGYVYPAAKPERKTPNKQLRLDLAQQFHLTGAADDAHALAIVSRVAAFE